MSDDELKSFLALVLENYRFTTSLDLEILGRVASGLSSSDASAILSRVRENDKDPMRLDIPAFSARARAAIEHANTKPSTPRRLVDWVRRELGSESCDQNGEELNGMSLVTKYFSEAWARLKMLPESSWRNRTRGMIRRQAKLALMELDWEEDDADEVAAGIVEMPYERPAEPKATEIAHLSL